MSNEAHTLIITERPNQQTYLDATTCLDTWAVLYQTEAHLDSGYENRLPHQRSIELGHAVDLNNYEQVALVDFSQYPEGASAFGLCQNGMNTESWSRSARSGEIDGMTLTLPLETDADGREWGHRSFMVGDIIFNQMSGKAYICANSGWFRAFTQERLDMDALWA